MSWLFSQALVEAYSAENCSDGEPSAQLNLMPTRHPFSRNGKTIFPSQFSRFGVTSRLLTEDRGKELLTWFQEVSLAKTLVVRGKAQASKEKGLVCGKKWSGWFVKWDRVLCLWKTRQRSLLGGLESFSETWPKWGSMQSGECSERIKPDLTISEKECGYLPTLVSRDSRTISGAQHMKSWTGTEGLAEVVGLKMKIRNGWRLDPTWCEWFMGWPMQWTELKPLETDKFQQWLDSHGKR